MDTDQQMQQQQKDECLECSNLKQQLDELKANISLRTKQRDFARKDKQHLKNQLEESKTKIMNLDKDFKQLTSNYLKKQGKIIDLQGINEELTDEKEKCESEKQKLEEDKRKLQQEKEKIQGDLKQLEKAYDRLNIDRNLLNIEVKKLKNQLNTHERSRLCPDNSQSSHPPLSHTWSTAPNKSQLQLENEALKRKLASLEQQIQKYYEKCEKYRYQLDTIVVRHQKEIKEKDQALMAVQQQISESDKAQNELEEEAEKYKKRSEQLEEYSIDLVKEGKSKQQKINELLKQLKQKEQEMQMVQAENTKKIKEIEQKQKFQFNKPSKDKTLKTLEQIIGSCMSRGRSQEIIQQIHEKLQLQSEYQKIIKTLEQRLDEAKKQNQARHKLLQDLMDQQKSKETADKMWKSDKQSLEQSLQKSKIHMVQIENNYQKRISQMDEELSRSKNDLKQTQVQKNELRKILSNKDDMIAYYIMILKEELKKQTPHVANQLLCNELLEFSQKILRYLPNDKQPPRSEIKR